jgi:mannose/fructose/N-acetylgalactosamine-specific phosphotransferase system component IID
MKGLIMAIDMELVLEVKRGMKVLTDTQDKQGKKIDKIYERLYENGMAANIVYLMKWQKAVNYIVITLLLAGIVGSVSLVVGRVL